MELGNLNPEILFSFRWGFVHFGEDGAVSSKYQPEQADDRGGDAEGCQLSPGNKKKHQGNFVASAGSGCGEQRQGCKEL